MKFFLGFLVMGLLLLALPGAHASFVDRVSTQSKPFESRIASMDSYFGLNRFESKSSQSVSVSFESPKGSLLFLEATNQRGRSRSSSLSSGEIVFLLSKNRRTYDFRTKKWFYPGKIMGENRSNFLDSLNRERYRIGGFYSLLDQSVSK